LSTDGFINHLNNNILGTRKCAVIVKKKKPALLSSLREQLYAKLNPDEIKSGEIALLTPQEAKGLEFDTCYVFTKGMNRNEKYISYTRALNELYIIP
jgi:DNA helicase IV